MDTENLVRMANRIGDFFESMPDPQEARTGIANHLQRFWDPRMRREIVAHVDEHGGAGLSPILYEVIVQSREQLLPTEQR